MEYLRGTVLESTPMLKVRLIAGVVVEAQARPDLQYRDTVMVAYDFTKGVVRKVLLPCEVETRGNNLPPEDKTKTEEIGDEGYVGGLLEPYVFNEE